MGKIHKLYFEKTENSYQIIDFTGTSIDTSCETFFGKLSTNDDKFALEFSDEKFNGAKMLFLIDVSVVKSDTCGIYMGVNVDNDDLSEIRLSRFFHDLFGEFPKTIFYRKYFAVR